MRECWHFHNFTYNFTVRAQFYIFLQFYNFQASLSHRVNACTCYKFKSKWSCQVFVHISGFVFFYQNQGSGGRSVAFAEHLVQRFGAASWPNSVTLILPIAALTQVLKDSVTRLGDFAPFVRFSKALGHIFGGKKIRKKLSLKYLTKCRVRRFSNEVTHIVLTHIVFRGSFSRRIKGSFAYVCMHG
jgi:hypothetical protein